ncbi:MAG: dihydropteroate synthase, partial [Clostridiales bacterium]|nr:dihydropteroate synthase [Clostridiales bacterium]
SQPFGLAELALELQAAVNTLNSSLSPIPYRARYLSGTLSFERPLVMGIANITPDSFYDGGKYNNPQAAAEHIFAMVEAGADIIDIGGASSRPGHVPLSPEQEMERLLPVLERVAPHLSRPISVDTDKARVAEEALRAGAAIINDISGLTKDMAELAARTGAPLVLMHQGGSENIVKVVYDFFREGLIRGTATGIKRGQFILDPGLGFGKNAKESLLLLRHLADFSLLGLPLLIGLSNKRFIGTVTGAPLEDRGAGNIAASAWAMSQGAAIIRTHEPKLLQATSLMISAIMECQEEGDVSG